MTPFYQLIKRGLLASLLLAGSPALATTYYLAANGNDANTPAQAQSPATPWQSLARLNAAMAQLQPGDQVLFRRGDVFRGQLVISRSGSSGAPLVFGAYGQATAAVPVLCGSTPLSGWTSAGPNLWEAAVPGGNAVTGLYTAAGKALPLGRYPNPGAANGGYLTIASHSGNTSLTCPQLVGSWVGATAVVRSIRWVLDRAPVTAQSGSTLTLGPFESTFYTRNGLPDGWGFFLQNHPATLDQAGEWYYYPARGVVRLYSLTAPANGALEAATTAPAGVVVRNQQYITLENLSIARTARLALDASSVSHLVMRGVQVRGADENGIVLSGTGTDVVLEDNLIQGVNNNAVHVDGYSNLSFRRNTLRSNGLVPGRGLSGDGQYYTFSLANGNQVALEENTVDSCGYVGLAYFSTSNISIARNLVSNFCLVKDDGGGIYTFNGGTPLNNLNGRILNNTVLNGRGAPQGTNDPSYVPAYGIYLDDCSRNLLVQGNTVAYCSSGGIFLHGSTSVTASDNTCFDNGAQLVISPAGACGSSGLLVQNNVLVSPRPETMVADYHVPATGLAQLGTLRNNFYAQPFSDLLYIRYEYQSYPLDEWQLRFGQDAGSVEGPVRYRPHRVQSFTGPERLTNGTFTSSINDWGYWASSGARGISWDNTNALGSGGSLRLLSPTPSATGGALTQSAIGSLTLGRSYAVRFAARSATGIKRLEVYLNQNHSPYADLTPNRRPVTLGPGARNYELILTTTATDASALLTFQGPQDSQAFWLDNVSMREATVIPASIGDSIRFEYNATAVPRTVALPTGARYVDVRNVAYSGSLTLAPYTSAVLFRVNAGLPSAARSATALVPALWPNPTTGQATLDLRALAPSLCRLRLVDATGRTVRLLELGGGQTHPLSMAGLPAGVYLLHGTDGMGTRVSLRLVKE